MPTAFERLIAGLPKDLKVLDVGYGGLNGENTTNYLRAHFGTIHGLCKDAVAVARYNMLYGMGDDHVVIGIYPDDMGQLPDSQYDLLVLDPNIEGNLQFWSEEGMRRAFEYVKDGGYVITYIMTTDDYGDETTQHQIREHKKVWWDVPRNLGITGSLAEERRPYITWVLIEKP